MPKILFPLGLKPIVLSIATVGILVGAGVFVHFQSLKNVPLVMAVRTPTTTPNPTQPLPTPTQIPTPTKVGTAKVAPKINLPTAKPSPATSQTNPSPTASPAQSTSAPHDTQAPSLTIQGGPPDGSTVEFANFCYPLYVSDNVSKYPNIWVSTRFDSANFGAWTTDVAPCYSGVTNGQHVFAVQAKDEAGNVTSEQKRTFTVSVITNGKISGITYGDVNYNGIQDAGERGIHFLKIILLKDGVSLASIGTEPNDGTFTFTDLSSGNYQVKAENATGDYQVTSPSQISVTISTQTSQITNLKFGVMPKSGIVE